MRFHFASLERSNQLANDLHSFLLSTKLSQMQSLAARLDGYADWRELEQNESSRDPLSAWDDAVPDGAPRKGPRSKQTTQYRRVKALLRAINGFRLFHPLVGRTRMSASD